MEGGGLVSGRDVLGKDNCISGGIEIRDLLFTITAAAMLCALKICSKLSLDGYRTSGRTNWPVILVYDGGIYQDGALIPGSGQALSNVDETIATYRRTFIKGYISDMPYSNADLDRFTFPRFKFSDIPLKYVS